MLRASLRAGAVTAALLICATTATATNTLTAAAVAPTATVVTASALPGAGSSGPDIPRLTDRQGRVLTLRGWNIEDKTHRGEQALTGITERHLRDLRAQGFDFARLLVFWDDLEPRPGRYSESYLRKIGRILDWADRYGVQVVIDAHQDVFGPAFGHRGIPAWATRTDGLPFTAHPDDWFAEYFEPAVQRAFTHLYEDRDLRDAQARMWRTLAARFARHPAVLGYDLINEPMGEARSGEDLATAARRIERDQLTPMYNRLVRAVRSADRDAWVFVEPTPIVGEGVPTGLGRVQDPRVVYAPHFYDSAMEAGADYDPGAGWIGAYERAVTAYPERYRVPVVVGEWGPPDSSLPHMNRFYRDAMASLGRYASGWAGYVWCYGGGYCAVDDAGAFRPNKELAVEPYAEDVAGRAVSASYDPGRGVYHLAYRAASRGSRVTVLSVPPGSWRVTATGGASVVRGPDGRARVLAAPGSRVTVTIERG
ncbi:cellulase family glycosylhydrolase [Streptomyces collinus]|uniref:Endoglycoceramidase n=1 Tax=Streptomyces collinus (strain DSM 40733 / Tue 365) TaxID=1214242 RepID=S5V830_STRC3|nr:cellulase family glycosylhydrolase [Streptomyces collinus]AGS66958.1 endoglycoceramidase [Streptomyces collinus Tu 365]AGS73736.1 endoglycoceramidase [Streptomyces collinus Tu 365]